MTYGTAKLPTAQKLAGRYRDSGLSKKARRRRR